MPDLLGLGTAQPRLNLTGASTPAQAQPLANAWKVGEILQATVLGVTGGGMTKLDINGLEVSTKAPLPLAAGDKLDLQVTQPGPPPQLRVLQHQPAQEAPLDQALRQALPRGGDAQLMARLGEALDTLGNASGLSTSQREALSQLQAALPNLRQLTDPAKLEQQMRASGLFLEHDLARGAPQPGDLKAALLRVLASLQQGTMPSATQTMPQAQPAGTQAAAQGQTPSAQPGSAAPAGGTPAASTGAAAPAQDMQHKPQGTYTRASLVDQAALAATRDTGPATAGRLPTAENALPQGQAAPLADTLRNAVEGALARVHLNQLTSLQTQGGDQPHWIMEIPLPTGREQTALHMRLEREGERKGAGGSAGEQGWRLDLDFDLEPLGPLRASVLMRGEQLNVRLWAERQGTLHQVRENLDLLQAGLQRTGLEVAHLACYPGQPAPREDDTPRPSGGLLNLSA